MGMSDVISIAALGLSVCAIYGSERAKSENKMVEKQERVAAPRLESQSLIAYCTAILRSIFLARDETSGYEKTIRDLQTIKSSALEVYDGETALESQSLIADCRAILRSVYLAKGETSGYEKTIQDLQTIKSSALEVYDEELTLESHLERADLREIARRLGHIRQERVKAEMIEKRLEDKWILRVDN